MIVLLFLIVTAVTGRNAAVQWKRKILEHILVLFQTISVFKSSSSFVLPCKALQQLAKAESRQHMVKRMERQERAMSKPEQPSPKQKYRKSAPFASAVDTRNGRTKRLRM